MLICIAIVLKKLQKNAEKTILQYKRYGNSTLNKPLNSKFHTLNKNKFSLLQLLDNTILRHFKAFSTKPSTLKKSNKIIQIPQQNKKTAIKTITKAQNQNTPIQKNLSLYQYPKYKKNE